MKKEKKPLKKKLLTKKTTSVLPLLPLKNIAILPKTLIPIIAGRDISIKAIEHALKGDRTIFISAQKEADTEHPTQNDIFQYGTRSAILQVMRKQNGPLKIVAEGLCRAKITKIHEDEEGFISVECEDIPTTGLSNRDEIETTWLELFSLYETYLAFYDSVPSDSILSAITPQERDHMTDSMTVHIEDLSLEERQHILELPDLVERMNQLCIFLSKLVEKQTKHRIKGEIQSQVDKNQREYYLHEQMKAIQQELGRDDQHDETNGLKQKINSINLSKEARQKVEAELKRLEQMQPLSSEAVVSRNYIECVISLPWDKTSKDTIDIIQAERILNKNHAGLKKPKERIVEFIAAKKFSPQLYRSPVICLAGPPGVGKTSLARSIAESMGREYVRISLGGIRDEAEIRGHRRTYIGALPGKIIQGMKKAGKLNPVILLDEIDKMSRDMHGDPAAALLEVLDPEQNKHFVDHFLDIGYDLSQVMFIATANMMEHIPYALYDRLEIISLSGYSEQEKLSIANKFLIPKGLKEYNLTKKLFKISDELILQLIDDYTKEAGVRQLERIIAKLMRKTIQRILEQKPLTGGAITKEVIIEWLGTATHKKTSMSKIEERIGLATGLAWTEIGGDVLEIETSALPGKGGMTLTGQLGEVMQESAQAAMSYIRSRAKDLGLKASFYTNHDIHLHIPEGATPKDGPSAGITICTALVSALTNKTTKTNLAMTGEITLQGRILSIGGLKEKLLAAKQHGCTTVLVPQENSDDIEDVKKEMSLEGLNIIFVKTMDEVLKLAFNKDPFIIEKKPMKKKTIKKKIKTT